MQYMYIVVCVKQSLEIQKINNAAIYVTRLSKICNTNYTTSGFVLLVHPPL